MLGFRLGVEADDSRLRLAYRNVGARNWGGLMSKGHDCLSDLIMPCLRFANDKSSRLTERVPAM
jgi:hypothetical protein